MRTRSVVIVLIVVALAAIVVTAHVNPEGRLHRLIASIHGR